MQGTFQSRRSIQCSIDSSSVRAGLALNGVAFLLAIVHPAPARCPIAPPRHIRDLRVF
jgi:hypothetical protein